VSPQNTLKAHGCRQDNQAAGANLSEHHPGKHHAVLRSLPAPLRRAIVIRNSSFGLLWTGQLLSALGTWFMVVAVPVYVFHLTHSARDTGLATVAEVVPMVIAGPLAGVLVDRWSRRLTMVASNIAQAGSVLLLICFTRTGLVWILLASVFAENALGTFFTPAYRGLVPFAVGRGADLEIANAWSTAARGITRLAGAPLGGVAYAALGFRWVVTLDAASYLISAACIAVMPVLRSASAHRVIRAAQSPTRRPHFLHDFAADLKTGTTPIIRDRALATMLAVTVLFLAGNGALSALLIPYISLQLSGNSATVGILLSALGAGYLLSAYAGKKACASPHLRASVLAMVAAIVATFAGFFNTRSLIAAEIFIGLAGIPGGAFLMLEQTLTQCLAPDEIIGRVSAVYSTAENAATLIGALLASLLEHALGLALTLNLAIAVIAAAGIPGLLMPRFQPIPPAVSEASVASQAAVTVPQPDARQASS
jgi:predicted MFS family arabinose efflux permease